MEQQMKFCKYCGEKIPADAVICTKCGRQVEKMQNDQSQIVINNTATASATANAVGAGKPLSKWVAFFLCLFLGEIGAHKFYEGKTGMGVLYLFTFGLFGIGWIIDTIALLFKPNPYYA